MSRFGTLLLMVCVAITVSATTTMATEEAKYTVSEKDGIYEIRDYAPCIVAEVVVDATFEEAGNVAFRRLFGYISGQNRSREKIAMTAPVSQEASSKKIEMTAPVGQQKSGSGWAVSFTMPASFTMETIPVPNDPGIILRQVPARRVAAVVYSGRWTQEGYEKHKMGLESWIKKKGLKIAGAPVWARYNPPFQLWFLRRNEVLILIQPTSDSVPR